MRYWKCLFLDLAAGNMMYSVCEDSLNLYVHFILYLEVF